MFHGIQVSGGVGGGKMAINSYASIYTIFSQT